MINFLSVKGIVRQETVFIVNNNNHQVTVAGAGGMTMIPIQITLRLHMLEGLIMRKMEKKMKWKIIINLKTKKISLRQNQKLQIIQVQKALKNQKISFY